MCILIISYIARNNNNTIICVIIDYLQKYKIKIYNPTFSNHYVYCNIHYTWLVKKLPRI